MAVRRRTFVLDNGRKTSATVEDAFWEALRDIARERGSTIADLIREIERSQVSRNLSSAIRVWVFREVMSSRGDRRLIASAHFREPRSLPR